MGTLSLIARALVSTAGLFTLVAACGDDGNGGASAQIRSFCESFVASPAFNCCNATDRADGQFILRYRFSSAAECESALVNQAAQDGSHQGFDGTAAQSCLSYLNTRSCGVTPTTTVHRDEETAGCARVLAGLQEEGQSCVSSFDCKAGLVCPPIKETGLSFCSKPAGSNQLCIGDQANSVDHPACLDGLFCSFIEVNQNGCPLPPCLTYKCVPPFDEGEDCTGLDCAAGLTCLNGSCKKGDKGTDGDGCNITDQCADGFYCEPNRGVCRQRKSDGEDCTPGNNPLFECKGICKGQDKTGTCASFCGQ